MSGSAKDERVNDRHWTIDYALKFTANPLRALTSAPVRQAIDAAKAGVTQAMTQARQQFCCGSV